MNIKSFIQRHQLLSYFVLAYGITWGSILILLALKGFRVDTIQTTDILPMLLLMILGPSTSSLVLTVILDERNGLRKLWTRMTQWRVGVQWWVIALLTIPLLVLAILSVLSAVVSPVFAPGFLLLGVVYGLLAGFLEELGWTGFATPRLLNKYNALTVGFILGLLWAFWHTLCRFFGQHQYDGRELAAVDYHVLDFAIDRVSHSDDVGLYQHGQSARGAAHARELHGLAGSSQSCNLVRARFVVASDLCGKFVGDGCGRRHFDPEAIGSKADRIFPSRSPRAARQPAKSVAQSGVSESQLILSVKTTMVINASMYVAPLTIKIDAST